MSYTLNYKNTPQATFTWSAAANLSYVVISWVGNTISTSTSVTTSPIYLPITNFTTTDLSLSTTYTFSMTPYNSGGGSGYSNNFSCDTTPTIQYFYIVNATYSSIQLCWSGLYSSISLTRSVGGGAGSLVAAATNLAAASYTDTDISGNTLYSYYITPTYNSVVYTKSSAVSLLTGVQPPTDVSINTYDCSSVKLSFGILKNSYSSSIIYTATATDASSNVVSATGTTSPILIQNMSGGYYYTCGVYVTIDSSSSLVATATKTASVTLPYGTATVGMLFAVELFT
jgi:hypothetical protein